MRKIKLELTMDESILLQTCCEFTEQFISSGNPKHEQMVKNYTQGIFNAEGLYWYADKMSFDIARLRESEAKYKEAQVIFQVWQVFDDNGDEFLMGTYLKEVRAETEKEELEEKESGNYQYVIKKEEVRE